MKTPVEEITAYLRSKELPKDEITYPPELMGQIAIQAFEEQEDLKDEIKDLELEIKELKYELQEAENSIEDFKSGLKEILDYM